MVYRPGFSFAGTFNTVSNWYSSTSGVPDTTTDQKRYGKRGECWQSNCYVPNGSDSSARCRIVYWLDCSKVHVVCPPRSRKRLVVSQTRRFSIIKEPDQVNILKSMSLTLFPISMTPFLFHLIHYMKR